MEICQDPEVKTPHGLKPAFDHGMFYIAWFKTCQKLWTQGSLGYLTPRRTCNNGKVMSTGMPSLFHDIFISRGKKVQQIANPQICGLTNFLD
jgi:hypothetical protein